MLIRMISLFFFFLSFHSYGKEEARQNIFVGLMLGSSYYNTIDFYKTTNGNNMNFAILPFTYDVYTGFNPFSRVRAEAHFIHRLEASGSKKYAGGDEFDMDIQSYQLGADLLYNLFKPGKSSFYIGGGLGYGVIDLKDWNESFDNGARVRHIDGEQQKQIDIKLSLVYLSQLTKNYTLGFRTDIFLLERIKTKNIAKHTIGSGFNKTLPMQGRVIPVDLKFVLEYSP